jgi:HSP20 family protein
MKITKKQNNRYPDRYEPETGLMSLRSDLDQMFDTFFSGFERPFRLASRVASMREFSPSIDLTDNEEEMNVSVELPGMSEKDVKVEIDEEMLTVSGEKKAEKEEENGNCRWKECSYGSFSRTIPLPSTVETDQATAHFRNGKLKIRLPKSEEAKKRRRALEIQAE